MPDRQKIVDALLALRERDTENAYLIFEEPNSGRFVQFTGSKTEPLLLDLPGQTLSDEEFYRAVELFRELGVEGNMHNLLDEPGGEIVGQQYSFNVVYDDVQAAAEIVERIFQFVYRFPYDVDLRVEEN